MTSRKSQTLGTKKGELLDKLRGLLKAELDVLTQAQRATVAGATHEEAKPENDKDTRALEQSYLALGQAERVEQLRIDVGLLDNQRLREFAPGDPAALGALVGLVEGRGPEQLILLVPAGAGETLASDSWTVRCVTPRSPLGRAVVGACAGDEIELSGPSGTRTLMITFIR